MRGRNLVCEPGGPRNQPRASLERVLHGIPEPLPVRWSRITSAALFSLVSLWAILFAITWAKWGNVTIDCGREMYVPWELSQGKTLYRDIWYLYGPVGPYLNSVLYRLWGVHLAVLYWAGSLSALGCAVLLYLTGMRLSSWLAGWAAGAVLLAEAFAPSLFSFPLPYSFAAVYGALAICTCFWCCVHAATSSGSGWLFAAGSAAALALLTKTEFGFGAYVAIVVLIAGRYFQTKSFGRLATDILAVVPGIAACLATIAWMISLRGANFLVQENLMSLPSTYFMQRYGAVWLRVTGLSFGGDSLAKIVMSFLAVLWFFAVRVSIGRYGAGWLVLLIGLTFGVIFRFGTSSVVAHSFFLPPALVFLNLASIPFLVFLAWQNRASKQFLGLLVLVVGSGVAASRTIFGTYESGYSIYYNGPAILSFLLLASWIAFPKTPGRALLARPAETLPFLALVSMVCLPVARNIIAHGHEMQPLETERGLIFLSAGMPTQYDRAIQFMKTAARRGESTLSVPEDTSLYFLSGTRCPTRVFAFTPGIVAPGKMTDQLINQMETKQVRYLIWSNRSFPEYGVPEFGKDFDQPLAAYFRSHYRPVTSLQGNCEWKATIWERKEAKSE